MLDPSDHFHPAEPPFLVPNAHVPQLQPPPPLLEMHQDYGALPPSLLPPYASPDQYQQLPVHHQLPEHQQLLDQLPEHQQLYCAPGSPAEMGDEVREEVMPPPSEEEADEEEMLRQQLLLDLKKRNSVRGIEEEVAIISLCFYVNCCLQS